MHGPGGVNDSVLYGVWILLRKQGRAWHGQVGGWPGKGREVGQLAGKVAVGQRSAREVGKMGRAGLGRAGK